MHNPTATLDLALTPGDFAIDARGVWAANSMSGAVRRHDAKFSTCVASEVDWNMSGKRVTT